MASCAVNAALKLKADERAAIAAAVSMDNRTEYFNASCFPITPDAEERMEQVWRL